MTISAAKQNIMQLFNYDIMFKYTSYTSSINKGQMQQIYLGSIAERGSCWNKT